MPLSHRLAVAALLAAPALAPTALVQVQERLRTAGAYQGRADGAWGPRTASRRWSASSRATGCR